MPRTMMAALDEFADIMTADYPLADLSCFGTGGPAEWLARPTTPEQLGRLVRRCRAEQVPYRLMGSGTNILVPDEGVRGVVICLSGEAFRTISAAQNRVKAGAGALLSELIAFGAQSSLSGLEVLVGIPGTVGGALRQNAGGRSGDIGQHVHSVEVMDEDGEVSTRMKADIRFGYRQSNLDDVVILGGQFELVPDDPEIIVRRIKKLWITKKARQPFGFQKAGYAFRNPRGLSAVELIERAGLNDLHVGGAELSDRDARFIVANDQAASRDVLQLIDLVRAKVEERTGVSLELQLDLW